LLDTHSDAPHINLRKVRTGGAKVSASLVADVRHILNASVTVQWGISEVGAGTFTCPDDLLTAASTGIGRAVTGAEVRIVSENGVELPAGETGELWYRSPYLFRGYLHDEEISRASVSSDG
jgi:cyclohexanecarboxylate-CoA ligase